MSAADKEGGMSIVVPFQQEVHVATDASDFPHERIIIGSGHNKVAFTPEHAEAICAAILSAKVELGHHVDESWILAQARFVGSPHRVGHPAASESEPEAPR